MNMQTFTKDEIKSLENIIKDLANKDLSSFYEIEIIGPYSQRLTFSVSDIVTRNYFAIFEIWKFDGEVTLGNLTITTTNHIQRVRDLACMLSKLDEYLIRNCK